MESSWRREVSCIRWVDCKDEIQILVNSAENCLGSPTKFCWSEQLITTIARKKFMGDISISDITKLIEVSCYYLVLKILV